MITGDVVALWFLAFVPFAIAIFLLICGIYGAASVGDKYFCVSMVACFIFLSFFSVIMLVGSYYKYQEAIPQNQVKILRQKISDAEKELQKYLIDHPELKEEIKEKY